MSCDLSLRLLNLSHTQAHTTPMKRALPLGEPSLGHSKEATISDLKNENSACSSLGDHLLVEILCRLPYKYAIQCKVVCKRWNDSIISSSYFVRRLIGQQLQVDYRHNCHHEKLVFPYSEHQLVITRQHLDRQFSLSFLPCHQSLEHDILNGFIIVASCNGLLLCRSRHGRLRDPTMYYVCNPITRQWVEVPSSPRHQHYMLYGIGNIGFICDPFYQVDDHGSITLNPHPRFRILCSYKNVIYVDVDIFSSETGMWSNINNVPRRRSNNDNPPVCIVSFRVVNCLGRMYFQEGLIIYVFDPLANNIKLYCGDIDLPGDLELNSRTKERLSCCRDSLWMCQFRNETATLHMWKLNENGVSANGNLNLNWSLERQVALPECELARHREGSIKVLAVHPDDPNVVLLRYSIEEYDDMIESWNLTERTIEILGHCDKDFNYSWTDMFYVDIPIWPAPVPAVKYHPDAASVYQPDSDTIMCDSST